MKTYTKLALIILFIGIVAIICTVAFSNIQSGSSSATSTSASVKHQLMEDGAIPVTQAQTGESYVQEDNDLHVVLNGKVVQTLSLGAEAADAFKVSYAPGDIRFISTWDVNFDGHNDVAVLTGIGYNGVNLFYDYYIFNPITSRLEKSSILTQISNPRFVETGDRQIISSYRDGPQWYTQVFNWNGTTYVKSDAVVSAQ